MLCAQWNWGNLTRYAVVLLAKAKRYIVVATPEQFQVGKKPIEIDENISFYVLWSYFASARHLEREAHHLLIQTKTH